MKTFKKFIEEGFGARRQAKRENRPAKYGSMYVSGEDDGWEGAEEGWYHGPIRHERHFGKSFDGDSVGPFGSKAEADAHAREQKKTAK